MSSAARVGGAATMKVVFLLLAISCCEANERWSRELTGESNEWVPLQSSISKRQASARVLNLPTPFQPNFFDTPVFQDYIPQEASRQLYLQSAPAEQSFLNQPNTLNQPIQLTLRGRFNPQPFIPQTPEEQQYSDFRQSVQEQFQQQPQSIPQAFNNQFYSNIVNPSQASALPFSQSPKPFKQEIPRFVDGYKVENVSGQYLGGTNAKAPLPSLREKVNENSAIAPNPQIMTERSSNYPHTTPSGTTVEKEEVQLLYVPLETLQNKKFDVKQFLKNSRKDNPLIDSVGSPIQFNNQLYSPTTPNYNTRQQTQLHNIQQDLLQQALNTQNLQGSFQNQNYFHRQSGPKYQQPSSPTALPFTQSFPSPAITTPRSKKLKAHQPPLAVFMVHKGQGSPQLSDVLTILKESRSISVLDTIIPDSPDIFVGPSSLKVPSKYAKFDLPYLSSIDGNRIQRKVNQLPFFVAPLSYKAPEGFAKIPFPAPHVGSVIVNPFMKESDDLPPSAFPSANDYSTFPQSPTTESFRSSTDQNNFSFFPSATPNPGNSQQSTLSGIKPPPFVPLEQSSFNQFRPQPSRQPEPAIINSSRAPQSAYFSTSARPSVSYFSFPGPDYSTLPTTKSPNPISYDNRGHYITNAAVDNSSPPRFSTAGRDTTTQQQTSPLPSTSKYELQNPYNINSAFQLKNPYEPTDFRTSVRGNEIRNYNTNNYRQPTGVTDQHLFNAFAQPEQKYQQFSNQNQNQNQNQQRPNSGFSTISDYSPRPYVTESFPKAISETKPPPVEETTPEQYDSFRSKPKETFSQSYNQYTNSPVEPEDTDVTQEIQYETEIPTTEITQTSTTTTTTTTTTTSAPPTTTKAAFKRRPLPPRGRPRYTTPKPDDAETTVSSRSTTRRVPIRERKPNTFRTKLESSRSTTTTTTDPSVESMSGFESARKGQGKFTTRQQYNRSKPDSERTTTETPTEKPTTRNTRVRMRGRTHFKATEGSDYIPKKKVKTEEDNIAYQRDVLHQNYPVTISERRSTLEVHTTTAMPSSLSSDRDNIRIYETTSNTQRSYSVQDTASSAPSSVYENEPIFQGEEERYITKPEIYVEINGNSPSGPTSEQYSPDKTTQRILISSSTPKYEELTEPKIVEDITEAILEPEIVEVAKEEEQISAVTEASSTPETPVFEEPAPKFRSKLRARPKLLSSLNIPKHTDDEYQSISDSFSSKKAEEITENSFDYTRKPLNSPSTYRPLFSNRRTTMKIEEIEEELTSKRKQVKTDSRPTTFKYPVFIPESTSAMPSPSADAESDFTPTTRRNHFIRRRPIRPTAAALETTTESQVTSVKPTNKRIRVRGRVRARTTTETPEISRSTYEEETAQSFSSPDVTTPRAPTKYRGRQPTTRYFKRPLSLADRTPQNTDENEEDQASFDSINRPEFVEFNSASRHSGKSDSHWSPKLSSNSFRPVYNPNIIADTVKTDVEFGTKINPEEPDIITARSPYEDVLISVTPASNHMNKPAGAVHTETRKDKSVKASDATSTFESVLEEVMRNLEEQDEDEYSKDYVAVMKHEGGEIGEIPPESTAETNHAKAIMNVNSEIRKISLQNVAPTAPTSFTTIAENRSFKADSDDTEVRIFNIIPFSIFIKIFLKHERSKLICFFTF